MKVVINSCYGGFSLSPLAVKRLAELRGEECHFFSHDYKTRKYNPISIKEAEKEFLWFAFKASNPNDIVPSQDDPKEKHQEFNKLHHDARPNDRSDSLLIQVVEELGEKANGKCSKLEIIEIPDNVDYYVDEYDGMETIRENHRSWS